MSHEPFSFLRCDIYQRGLNCIAGLDSVEYDFLYLRLLKCENVCDFTVEQTKTLGLLSANVGAWRTMETLSRARRSHGNSKIFQDYASGFGLNEDYSSER